MPNKKAGRLCPSHRPQAGLHCTSSFLHGFLPSSLYCSLNTKTLIFALANPRVFPLSSSAPSSPGRLYAKKYTYSIGESRQKRPFLGLNLLRAIKNLDSIARASSGRNPNSGMAARISPTSFRFSVFERGPLRLLLRVWIHQPFLSAIYTVISDCFQCWMAWSYHRSDLPSIHVHPEPRIFLLIPDVENTPLFKGGSDFVNVIVEVFRSDHRQHNAHCFN